MENFTQDGDEMVLHIASLKQLNTVWPGDHHKIIKPLYEKLISGETISEKKGRATLTKFDRSVHGEWKGITDLKGWRHARKPKRQYICPFTNCGKELSTSGSLSRHKKSCKHNVRKPFRSI